MGHAVRCNSKFSELILEQKCTVYKGNYCLDLGSHRVAPANFHVCNEICFEMKIEDCFSL